ncbi:hypothetical protein [Mumia zhuanghuii]|uniref:Uncharacterized protein n=1 Tax=Mumia zhuanghuii TaxID=2585211 RepID=A0A5C4LX30_9ACTN|nr:hypothetical protein [Mumia zhuanghuii]TNC22442.1 hypothetical protein FHE65_35770 [Mumia zhuanghuii]
MRKRDEPDRDAAKSVQLQHQLQVLPEGKKWADRCAFGQQHEHVVHVALVTGQQMGPEYPAQPTT